MDLNIFTQQPLMGILRGINKDMVEPIVETVISSGLKTIEITMNTPGAAGLISEMVKSSTGKLIIGAGTVLSLEDLKKAIDAGASFIVMPALIEDVTLWCVKNSIPVFPGALTPQEIYRAWQSGATMVKVFPSKIFGPGYFKELHGPFQDIKLLACGGITPENISSYFSSGASAVAFGGSIFKKEWLIKGEFNKIATAITSLIQANNRG